MKAFLFLSAIGFFGFFSYQPPDAVEQVQAALEIAIAEPVEIVAGASDDWMEAFEEIAVEEEEDEDEEVIENEGEEDVTEISEVAEEEVTVATEEAETDVLIEETFDEVAEEEDAAEPEHDEVVESASEGNDTSAEVEVDEVETFEVPVIVVDPLLVLDQESDGTEEVTEEAPVEEGSIVEQLIETVE